MPAVTARSYFFVENNLFPMSQYAKTVYCKAMTLFAIHRICVSQKGEILSEKA